MAQQYITLTFYALIVCTTSIVPCDSGDDEYNPSTEVSATTVESSQGGDECSRSTVIASRSNAHSTTQNNRPTTTQVFNQTAAHATNYAQAAHAGPNNGAAAAAADNEKDWQTTSASIKELWDIINNNREDNTTTTPPTIDPTDPNREQKIVEVFFDTKEAIVKIKDSMGRPTFLGELLKIGKQTMGLVEDPKNQELMRDAINYLLTKKIAAEMEARRHNNR